MKANEVAGAIKNKIQMLRSKMLNINEQILERQRQVVAIKDQQAKIYQRIAAIYLLESPQQAHLQTIQGLVDKLQFEFATLETQLAAQEKQVAECQLKQADLQQELSAKTAERDSILAADSAFTSLINDIVTAQQDCQQTAKIHEESSEEFTRKLADYSSDNRYNYLIKRKFSEPDYRGFWIFRHMDQWLARQVNFVSNYKNQKIIEGLLAESVRRVNNSNARYQALVASKDQMIAAVEQRIGLSPICKAFSDVCALLATYQHQREQTYQELTDSQQGRSGRFAAISSQLAAVMQELSVDKLTELTRQTRSKEDDYLIGELLNLTQQISGQEKSINDLRGQYKDTERAFGKVSQLEFEFNKANMNSRSYLYKIQPSIMDDEIDAIIDEKQNPSDVIKYLRKLRSNDSSGFDNNDLLNVSLSILTVAANAAISSRSSGSSSSRSSGSWSSGSSSSSSSSGSFSSSSSSGGGGFRTTDSF